MPLEAKPLFRPDVLRTHLGSFAMPDRAEAAAPKLAHWAELLSTRRADNFKEQEILPDFLTDFFCGLLGYTRPADGQPDYTISREKHVEVDGKFADAVLGQFNGQPQYLVALDLSGLGRRDAYCTLASRWAGRKRGPMSQRLATIRTSADEAIIDRQKPIARRLADRPALGRRKAAADAR